MPLLDFSEKCASVFNGIIKAVTKKVTIFCIIMMYIAHYKLNDISKQPVAFAFRVEELCNIFFIFLFLTPPTNAHKCLLQ